MKTSTNPDSIDKGGFSLTDRIDAVFDYTPIHFKTNTKLTNFIK